MFELNTFGSIMVSIRVEQPSRKSSPNAITRINLSMFKSERVSKEGNMERIRGECRENWRKDKRDTLSQESRGYSKKLSGWELTWQFSWNYQWKSDIESGSLNWPTESVECKRSLVLRTLSILGCIPAWSNTLLMQQIGYSLVKKLTILIFVYLRRNISNLPTTLPFNQSVNFWTFIFVLHLSCPPFSSNFSVFSDNLALPHDKGDSNFEFVKLLILSCYLFYGLKIQKTPLCSINNKDYSN